MKQTTFWRGVLSVLALGFCLFFVAHVWNILVPFILGLMAAYLVQPLVDRFVARGLRRDRTVLVLYVILLSSVLGAGFLIVPNLVREANASLQSIPIYAHRFNALNDSLSAELSRLLARVLGKRAHPVVLPFRADALAERFVNQLPENISSVAHIGLWVIIIPFVCYFALAQGKHWVDLLFNLTPSEYVEHLLGLMAEIDATLGAYIRGQLLDAMCVGMMTMVGLWLIGFDQAVLLGVLTGLLNPVPFLAPVVGGSVALLMGYFQGLGASSLIGIFCLFLLVRLCDDFIFTPFIVGQSVKLHPVVMLFAILAGVEVGGVLGLVFAVPCAAVIKVVLTAVINQRHDEVRLRTHHFVS